jgi:hypothetical protein
MPGSNGTYRLGSKVSVCAIPPAIQSSTMQSAVAGNAGSGSAARALGTAASAANAAAEALPISFRKSRRCIRLASMTRQ